MLRLQCVSLKAESPPFQSSTQYGEEKRYYNDDIVFKVSTMNGIELKVLYKDSEFAVSIFNPN